MTREQLEKLMEMDEKHIDTIQAAGISNSQQYRLAGNSIVVAVLERIFKNLLVNPAPRIEVSVEQSLFNL